MGEGFWGSPKNCSPAQHHRAKPPLNLHRCALPLSPSTYCWWWCTAVPPSACTLQRPGVHGDGGHQHKRPLAGPVSAVLVAARIACPAGAALAPRRALVVCSTPQYNTLPTPPRQLPAAVRLAATRPAEIPCLLFVTVLLALSPSLAPAAPSRAPLGPDAAMSTSRRTMSAINYDKWAHIEVSDDEDGAFGRPS